MDVDAATGDAVSKARLLGAPPELPALAATEWLRFATAPPPEVEAGEDGRIALKKQDKHADTYAFYFAPAWDEMTMKLKCRLSSCASKGTISFMVTSATRSKLEFPFSNAHTHLLSCKGSPLLTREDAAARANPSAGGSAKKRGPAAGASDEPTGASLLVRIGMSEAEHKELLMRRLVIDAQPLAIADRIGERLYNRGMGIPLVPAQTMRDFFKSRYEDIVESPAKAMIAAWQTPTEVVADGYKYRLTHGFSLAADGVKVNDATHESLSATVGVTSRAERFAHGATGFAKVLGPATLRPKTFPLGMTFWQIGKHGTAGHMAGGTTYGANAHADFLFKMAAKVNISNTTVRRWIMDTTNGNPAMLREPVWSHAMFIECLQHLLSLAVEDLMGEPSFAAPHDASQAVSVYLKRSPRRCELLKMCVVSPAGAAKPRRSLMPKTFSKTRFAKHLIQMARTVEIAPDLAVMNSKCASTAEADNAFKAVPEFPGHYSALLTNMQSLADVTRILAKPVEMCIAAAGSDSAYTSSILYDVFDELWEKGTRLRAIPATRNIGIRWQSSLLERIATVALAGAYYEGGVHVQPSFLRDGFPAAELERKLTCDSRVFTAMMLDPACSADALSRAPDEWIDDVCSYLYDNVVRPSATLVGDAPAPPPAVPASKALMAAEIKSITSEEKPRLMGEKAWAEDQKERIAAVKERYKSKDDGMDGDDVVIGGVADPFMPLHDALKRELRQHKEFLQARQAERKAYKPPAAAVVAAGGAGAAAAAGAGGPPPPPTAPKPSTPPWRALFGHPLSEGPPARYEFWPSKQATMPLLYFCAEEVLAGDRAATTFNERLHTPAQRIASKLRAGLKPLSVEQLTLAHYYLREEAKKTLAEMEGDDKDDALDWQEL